MPDDPSFVFRSPVRRGPGEVTQTATTPSMDAAFLAMSV